MKYYNIIKHSFAAILFVLAGCFITACEEDINMGKEDESKYLPVETGIFVVDQHGKKDIGLVEFREKGNIKLFLNLNQSITADINASFKFDETILEKYNKDTGNDYGIFPKSLVSFANEGVVKLTSGSKRSDEIVVEVTSNGTLDPNKSYALPLRVSVQNGNTDIASKEAEYLVLVKDLTGIPNPDKYVIGEDGQSRRVQIISCMEINDTNPLNNLAFTLKESGKPLIDVVILFSANINYNAREGRVYVHQNEQVTAILGNREKYLKPLQDRGIKVVLGILPNHDRAGITNLAEETAKGFVQELKAYMDAYNLDGVFWDDEYDSQITPPPPGFVSRSNQATSFLIHEFNRVMPDKLNMVYVYNGTSSLSPVGDKQGGEYITHALHDYGGGYGLDGNYPGLPKSGWGMYSEEFNRGYYTGRQQLIDIKNNGYSHMIFALDPVRAGYQYNQRVQLRYIASDIFEDELVEGEFYKKDY